MSNAELLINLQNQNQEMQQSEKMLQSKYEEVQNELSEQSEMVTHLEFENNRQYTQHQNEMMAKDQAMNELKIKSQLEEQQSLAKQVQLEKQIQMLQQKLSGSPISGGTNEPSTAVEMNLPEARQSLLDKSKQINELLTK